jgi:hypothetical protein
VGIDLDSLYLDLSERRLRAAAQLSLAGRRRKKTARSGSDRDRLAT